MRLKVFPIFLVSIVGEQIIRTTQIKINEHQINMNYLVKISASIIGGIEFVV